MPSASSTAPQVQMTGQADEFPRIPPRVLNLRPGSDAEVVAYHVPPAMLRRSPFSEGAVYLMTGMPSHASTSSDPWRTAGVTAGKLGAPFGLGSATQAGGCATGTPFVSNFGSVSDTDNATPSFTCMPSRPYQAGPCHTDVPSRLATDSPGFLGDQ